MEHDLADITGYDGVSIQPNSGAQGEYAGLRVIRAYHQSRGDNDRDICLIPVSAHGTNPASAAMAGMDVIIVKCETNGDLDMEDLEKNAAKYKDRLAAFMVTYPSTYGVFETGVTEACNIIHKYGGQVYMDGANLNAQIGLCTPAEIGADVCHLNLHKTLVSLDDFFHSCVTLTDLMLIIVHSAWWRWSWYGTNMRVSNYLTNK